MKITKEAIHTDTEALASKMAGLTDAVADAPSEWSDKKPEPDWDSAPEGATHVLMHDIHGASWRRKGGFGSWYYWDEDKWVFMGEGGFMSDEYIERPRPEQSKSTEPKEPQEQEWNGEGLPPVGYECEFSTNDLDWHICKPMMFSYHAVFLKSHKANKYDCKEYSIELKRIKFRKIKSTAERKRDSLIAEFDNVLRDSSWDDVTLNLANYLIDNEMLNDRE